MSLNAADRFFNNRSESYERAIEEGIVLTLGDGIVKACGLEQVTSGELVMIGPKYVKGMALNLEHDKVGIVIFGNDRDVNAGDFIIRTFGLMQIGLGMALFGRVIDGLGNNLLEEGLTSPTEGGFEPIDSKAIGVIGRKRITEPMQTGIKLIDSLVPIGCGQRELIIGDRQTGKTSIAIDTIINQKLN
jgi:F-type H+-transporting ATPase subunit alpha